MADVENPGKQIELATAPPANGAITDAEGGNTESFYICVPFVLPSHLNHRFLSSLLQYVDMNEGHRHCYMTEQEEERCEGRFIRTDPRYRSILHSYTRHSLY